MNTRNWTASLLLVLFSISSALAQSPTLDWAYRLGASSADAARGQTTDAAGNIYTVGYFSGTMDLNPGPGFLNVTSAGDKDIFIQKMDASGNFIWGKRIGGVWADQANDVAVDNAGNVYVTGSFKNTVDFDPGTGVFNMVADNVFQSNCVFILKLNSSGTFQWAKKAEVTTVGYAVATDNTGNVYLSGYMNGWADFGTSSIAGDVFFWKLDGNGNHLWAKALDDVDNNLSVGLHGMKVDGAGNVFATGQFAGTQDFMPGNGVSNLVSNGSNDIYLLNLNTLGTFQWVKQFGGGGLDIGQALHRTNSGDMYIAGVFSGVADFDPGSGTGQYAFQSAGSTDIFALKTNSNGDVQWAAAFGGPAFDYAGDITVNAANEVAITGYFQGTADFDPDLVDTYSVTSSGQSDVFIEKLSATGDFQWVRTFGSTGIDEGWSVHYNGGSLYAGGGFSATADFDPSAGVFNMTASGSTDIYITKFDECLTTTSTISAVSCGAYTSPSGNNTWTTAGSYTDVIPNTAGCDSIITINLTIQDSEAPVADLVNLAAVNAQCEVNSLTAPTATDVCAGAITGTHNATFPITSNTTITWTYDDGNGNASTQTQNVVINDLTAPVANVGSLPNVTGQCEVTTLVAPTATDNCEGAIVGTHNATFPITSNTTITWTYDDGNGNTSTQTQNVTINDVTAPVANVGSLANVTAQCEVVSLTAPTATDNCSGAIVGTHNATLPITSSTTIIWTYDDGNGNTSTQTQNVVINDNEAPVADAGSLADVNGVCQVIALSAPTATDNCAGAITGTHNATFPITSNTAIIWTYDDGNGNTSTQTQNVVVDDNAAPVANSASLAAVNAQCEVNSLTAPTATDNCAGAITGTHNATFPITSNTTITWTYDDGNGNTSTQTQNVVINDNTAPVANVGSLADVTAQCEVNMLTAPTATDNCAGAITGTHNATLPITASTTITWTYDDGNGNTSTQTQNVVVDDNTAPVANSASLAAVNAQCEVNSLTAPTATDNCAGAITGTHNATFPITLNTTITWTYDDGNGNTSTQTQNVVISDFTAPVPNMANLADLTDQCQIASLTAPTATDNCVGSVTATHNASLPITTSATITWTYDDGNGNTSTQTQNVIITDFTAPIPDAASLADVTAQCSVPFLTAPTATDNCAGTVTATHNALLPITSSVTVTWTYDDGNGNTSTQNQNVVINDVTAPVPSIANLPTIDDECEIVALTAPTANDNCVGPISATHNATLPITASTTLTWTYDDGNGNTSTQTQNVNITPISNALTQVDPITFMADASAYSYQWVDCNNGNAPVVGETGQTFVATNNGNYAVEIGNGTCSVTSACVSILTVGIDGTDTDRIIAVYPNPTDGNVTIELGDTFEEVSLQVIDALGRVVLSQAFFSVNQIDLNMNMAAGCYFLQLQAADETLVRMKMIKR